MMAEGAGKSTQFTAARKKGGREGEMGGEEEEIEKGIEKKIPFRDMPSVTYKSSKWASPVNTHSA